MRIVQQGEVRGVQLLEESRDRANVLEVALTTDPVPITAVRDRRSGAYVILYSGDLAMFRRVRRPTGRSATASISEDGGAPIYVGSGLKLAERFRRHLKNLKGVRSLRPRDLTVVLLATQSFAGARYAEELLIDAFDTPILNCRFLAGFGSRRQGKTREDGQRTAPFNILFPGRAGCSGTSTVTADELELRVVQYLGHNVPSLYTRVAGDQRPLQAGSAKVLSFRDATPSRE